MTISALNVQLNCSLVTKNIDVFAPSPHLLAKIYLNYSFSSWYFVACWFLCVVKSIWLLHQIRIFKLSFNE